MLNSIIVMGRLTKDPELRTTTGGTPVASFTLAVDRDYIPKGQEKQADFINCTAWNKTAEFVSKYFRKATMMLVTGSLQSRKWTDKDGNKRTDWEILVDRCYFGEHRPVDGYGQMDGVPKQQYNVFGGYDGELPF